MKSYFLTLIFGILISLNVASQSANSQNQLLDNYITDAITKWEPPGLAVTVVKDGEIVFTKGYGVRTSGTNNKVDENTLFVCASTTKAFVAAGIAMLVDDGKLQWDDHVINHLPEFQLYDPYVTRELTIRDLLTHRSGVGNTDYLWALMTISGDSALHKMREVKPSYSFRAGYIYQNLMYLAAGKVIESVSNMSWGTFLKERIYKPLEMNNTHAMYKNVKDIHNKADAHYKIDNEIVQIEQMIADNIGPAGSMWSSINDMGKWIKFLLNNGQKNRDTLIKPNTFKELFKPQQIIPEDQFYPTTKATKPNWTTYGLGWFQHDYRGKMVQFHTGSLAGMVAIAGMIPEENIGVYVMGNLDHVELRHAIMYTVFDLFMDGEITRDWSTELYALYNPEIEPQEEPKPIKNAKPAFDISEIIGNYSHSIYGNIEISIQNKSLTVNFNNTLSGTLSHWHFDTYQLNFDKKEYGKTMLTFRMGVNGKISHLELNFFGQEISFTYD
jgi:CubicO group peptidase (beta-lactamase class C family)